MNSASESSNARQGIKTSQPRINLQNLSSEDLPQQMPLKPFRFPRLDS